MKKRKRLEAYDQFVSGWVRTVFDYKVTDADIIRKAEVMPFSFASDLVADTNLESILSLLFLLFVDKQKLMVRNQDVEEHLQPSLLKKKVIL